MVANANAGTQRQPPSVTLPPQGYIVSATYDHVFFIWPPLIFLAIGFLVYLTDASGVAISFGDPASGGKTIKIIPALVLTFTMAHVFAVVFRSHVNPNIFRLYPYRFVAVPIALVGLFLVSDTAWLIGIVAMTWMDNWHSSLQTFGFGRLYDQRAGNDANVGRRLDFCMSLVIFLGPILAGTTLATHLVDLERFDEVGLDQVAQFPGWAVAHQAWFSIPILIGGGLFLIYYGVAYWRLAQRGYQVSYQKVLLYLALGITSIYTWSFDSFGQSFLIMESYHSLQYFALVWWSERSGMQKAFGLTSVRGGVGLTFAVFIGVSTAFGLWVAVFSSTYFEYVIFGVVEVMHYWYDGFIWSVRRRQVG